MGRRTAKEHEEVQALRQENADLRRTVLRLRKELKHRPLGPESERDPVPQDILDPVELKALGRRTSGPRCEKCGGEEFRFFKSPSATIRICTSCTARQKV